MVHVLHRVCTYQKFAAIPVTISYYFVLLRPCSSHLLFIESAKKYRISVLVSFCIMPHRLFPFVLFVSFIFVLLFLAGVFVVLSVPGGTWAFDLPRY